MITAIGNFLVNRHLHSSLRIESGRCGNALIYIAIETKILYCDVNNKVDVASCLEYHVAVVTCC